MVIGAEEFGSPLRKNGMAYIVLKLFLLAKGLRREHNLALYQLIIRQILHKNDLRYGNID